VSASNNPQNSSQKPHRRLSLTMPTQAPPLDDEAAPGPADTSQALEDAPSPTRERQDQASSNTGTDAPPGEPTARVMAYLTSEESRLLDELWITRRRQPTRPSKSDILRAALILATQDEKNLDVVLSQQHVSTASRQRSSKAAPQRRPSPSQDTRE